MINDMNILRLEKLDKDKKIPRMSPVRASKDIEYWSFWGLEEAYQKIDGRNRLRYHLGHVLFANQLCALHNENNAVKPVIMNYRGAGERHAKWKPSDLDITERFLKILLGDTITPTHITDWVDKVRHSSRMPLYDKIKEQTWELTKPIRDAYDNFKQNEHTLYYLEKYRDLSITDLQYIPPCLTEFYENSDVKGIVPSHVFFAAIFALHRNGESDSHFVNGFWVQEGFPLLACIRKVEGRNIRIIEGKRSAYIWLFIDYLRIWYNHKNGGELDLPDVVYLDSLPSLHGAPFMQLGIPREALFIDSFSREMKEKMSHMSEAVMREYSLRVLGINMPSVQKSWLDGAVSACETKRTLIAELLYKHTNKKKEAGRALIDFGKEINPKFRACTNLYEKLMDIYAKQ